MDNSPPPVEPRPSGKFTRHNTPQALSARSLAILEAALVGMVCTGIGTLIFCMVMVCVKTWSWAT